MTNILAERESSTKILDLANDRVVMSAHDDNPGLAAKMRIKVKWFGEGI